MNSEFSYNRLLVYLMFVCSSSVVVVFVVVVLSLSAAAVACLRLGVRLMNFA